MSFNPAPSRPNTPAQLACQTLASPASRRAKRPRQSRLDRSNPLPKIPPGSQHQAWVAAPGYSSLPFVAACRSRWRSRVGISGRPKPQFQLDQRLRCPTPCPVRPGGPLRPDATGSPVADPTKRPQGQGRFVFLLLSARRAKVVSSPGHGPGGATHETEPCYAGPRIRRGRLVGTRRFREGRFVGTRRFREGRLIGMQRIRKERLVAARRFREGRLVAVPRFWKGRWCPLLAYQPRRRLPLSAVWTRPLPPRVEEE